MLRLHVMAALALGTLCSCDVDLFGTDTTRVAGGYRVTRVDWPMEFQFAAPNGADPLPLAEIGWRKPLILVRAQESRQWQVIDTTTRERITISDEERRTDPAYSSIQLFSAEAAWQLPRRARRW